MQSILCCKANSTLPDRILVYACRRVWQYAVNAVLQDLGKQQPHKLSSQHLREWRRQRQRVQTKAQISTTAVAAATADATAAVTPDTVPKAPQPDHSSIAEMP